jgi:hypothetical protein
MNASASALVGNADCAPARCTVKAATALARFAAESKSPVSAQKTARLPMNASPAALKRELTLQRRDAAESLEEFLLQGNEL